MRHRSNGLAAAGALFVAALVLAEGCARKPAGTEGGRGGEAAATAPARVEAPPAAQAQATTESPAPQTAPEQPAASGGKLVPIPLKLPRPAFIGTPKNIPPGTTVEKPTGKPRPPFLAPEGVTNVALRKPVTASDSEPIIGELALVTDGEKEATEGSYVEFGPGVQYVQIDLEGTFEIFAIVFWHFHADPRVYRDVVVQVADDPDFIENVRTLFNNDQDNSAGLGIGKDREYFETYEGKLIDAKGVKARYVRIYTKGSTADDMNHFTEVEVYGRPAGDRAQHRPGRRDLAG